jgi:hypothetical protein
MRRIAAVFAAGGSAVAFGYAAGRGALPVEITSAPQVAAVVLVVVLALFMVWAMVQWSRVRINAPPRERSGRGRRRRRRDAPAPPAAARGPRRGWIYLGSWVALIGAYLLLFRVTGAGWTARNLALLAGIAAAYLAVNLVLIAFARAIIRAGGGPPRRDRARAPAPAAAARTEARDASEAGAAGEVGGGAEPAARGVAAAVRGVFETWRSGLRPALWVAGVVLAIAVVGAQPDAGAVEAWFDARRRVLLPPLVAAAFLGWALLIGMAIALVLARDPAARRSGASVAEVKRAWRSGAWRTRPWRPLFAGLAAAALMAIGLFGLGVVLAPAGIKALCAGALLYAAVRAAIAFARA